MFNTSIKKITIPYIYLKNIFYICNVRQLTDILDESVCFYP